MAKETGGKPADIDVRGRAVLTRVNAEGLKAMRKLALERDTTLQALCIEAVNDVLRKHGRRPVVRNPLLGP